MRRTLLGVGLVLSIAAAVGAVDVVLRDGTVIHATSYQLTGSYVTLLLPDGRQVAYSTSDVDLDALKAQEAAVDEEAPAAAAPEGMSAALAQLDAPAGVTISDADVEHVGPVEEGTPAAPGGPPPGFQEGGQVGLQNVRLDQVEPGVWEATGEVVNRTDKTVREIRVQLELHTDAEGLLARSDVPVTSMLEPTVKASFSHRFSVVAERTPRLRGRVFWMQDLPAEQRTPAGGGGTGTTSTSSTASSSAAARPTPRS